MAPHFSPQNKMPTRVGIHGVALPGSSGLPDPGAACDGLYAQHSGMAAQLLIKGLGRFAAGSTAFVLGRHLGGGEPAIYHGDHGNPQSAKIRSLAEEIGRVVRARVTNPKWIAGAMRHGYKGAFEMAATVDYLVGFDATTHLVSDTHYALVTEAYVQNEDVRQFLRDHNPQALSDIVGRLLEAIDRGMWEQPGALHDALLEQMLTQEEFMEGRVRQ